MFSLIEADEQISPHLRVGCYRFDLREQRVQATAIGGSILSSHRPSAIARLPHQLLSTDLMTQEDAA
jgi:hypothetical protein